jgi:hypothetical protein
VDHPLEENQTKQAENWWSRGEDRFVPPLLLQISGLAPCGFWLCTMIV